MNLQGFQRAMMLRTGKLNCGCDDETADALDGNVTDFAPRRMMLVEKVAHWSFRQSPYIFRCYGRSA